MALNVWSLTVSPAPTQSSDAPSDVPSEAPSRNVGGGSQTFDVRKFFNEPLEIRFDRLDLRLLQHHLTNPNAVGIRRFPPRQIAFVFRIPGKQSLTKAALPSRVERCCSNVVL